MAVHALNIKLQFYLYIVMEFKSDNVYVCVCVTEYKPQIPKKCIIVYKYILEFHLFL